MVEEGDGFELPSIDRQLIARRRQNHPFAIGRRRRVFEEIIAAELVQVEIAEVLHDHEGDLDLVELAGGPDGKQVAARVFPSIIQFAYHSRTGLTGVLRMKLR